MLVMSNFSFSHSVFKRPVLQTGLVWERVNVKSIFNACWNLYENSHISMNGSVSTEIFEWGFLYLLVGKVGGTKNEMEVQEGYKKCNGGTRIFNTYFNH